MRVGLFGGTFDPPHIAHLVAAESARSFVGLGKVIWIPASVSPHRSTSPVASPLQRLEMVHLCTADHENFDVSEIELQRKGISFTVDTLREISAANAEDELFLIMGGDSLRSFQTWRDPDEILSLAKLVVMGRDTNQYDDVRSDVRESTTVLPATPLMNVSSSIIRKMITARMSVRYLIPDNVADYIQNNRIYGPEPRI